MKDIEIKDRFQDVWNEIGLVWEKLESKTAEEVCAEDKVKEVRKRIGMLRQWLNENRLTEPHKMVTNEELNYFLNL
jgi:hypothetical protein